MKKHRIRVLCTKADREDLVVKSMLIILRGLLRRDDVDDLQIIEVDAPQFVLTERQVDIWIRQQAIVIPLITPSLVGNSNMADDQNKFGKLIRVSSREGAVVIPVYCLEVTDPNQCQFGGLIWAASGMSDWKKPLPTPRKARTHAGIAVEEEICCLLDDRTGRRQKKDAKPAADSPKPLDLAFVCAPEDYKVVRAGMDGFIELLCAARNIGCCCSWEMAGSQLSSEIERIASAKHLVVFTSSECLSMDSAWKIMVSRRQAENQQVTFMSLAESRTESLPKFEEATWFPLPDKKKRFNSLLNQRGGKKEAVWMQFIRYLAAEFTGS